MAARNIIFKVLFFGGGQIVGRTCKVFVRLLLNMQKSETQAFPWESHQICPMGWYSSNASIQIFGHASIQHLAAFFHSLLIPHGNLRFFTVFKTIICVPVIPLSSNPWSALMPLLVNKKSFMCLGSTQIFPLRTGEYLLIFYGDLSSGHRAVGEQKKRFKDRLKATSFCFPAWDISLWSLSGKSPVPVASANSIGPILLQRGTTCRYLSCSASATERTKNFPNKIRFPHFIQCVEHFSWNKFC